MSSTNLAVLVPWIITHGYFLFLLAAIIEGPFVTMAAGVAAALGYFNIFIIMLLAIAGDVGGDLLYYGIGYKANRIIRSPVLKYIGLTDQRIKKIETLLHTHTQKAIFLIKLSPVIGPAGIMIIGTLRVSFRKFFKTALIIGVPKSIFFALLGFYSGKTYTHLSTIITAKQHLVWEIGAALLCIYIAYVKITGSVTKKLEE